MHETAEQCRAALRRRQEAKEQSKRYWRRIRLTGYVDKIDTKN